MVINQYQCQVFIAIILISHSLAAPQIGGGAGAGAGGGGGGGAAVGGGAAGGAGGAAGAGAASAAAGAAMMAAGTGMMMNPMFPLFPLMLAGASFAKVTIVSASLLLTDPAPWPGVLHRAPAAAPPRPPQTGRSPLPPPSRLPPPPPASLPPVPVSSVPVLDSTNLITIRLDINSF